MMKRKYGEGWTPGLKREKDRVRAAEHRRKLRELKAKEQECQIPNEPGPLDLIKTCTEAYQPPLYPFVMVTFHRDDQELYERLEATAKKERRTPDQQILLFVEEAMRGA
jgi:hypothetical protein